MTHPLLPPNGGVQLKTRIAAMACGAFLATALGACENAAQPVSSINQPDNGAGELTPNMTNADNIKALMTRLRSTSGGMADAMAVARLGGTATPFLIGATRDPVARVRGLACFALGQSMSKSTEETRQALQARLHDDDHEVRWVAVRSLGNLKATGALASIEATRRSDTDEAVRDAAGEAILEITGKPPALLREIQALLSAFGSDAKLERENAINEIGLAGLAHNGDVKHERVLRSLADRMLRDEYFQCRSASALALQRIAETPAFVVDALIKAMDDKDLRVQAQALAALDSFGPAAAPALPRVKELAGGTGPLAEQAQRTVKKLGGQ